MRLSVLPLALLVVLLLGVNAPAFGQVWHRTPVMPNLEFGRTVVDRFGHIWTASPGIGLCEVDPLTILPVIRFRTDRPITSIMAHDSLLLIIEERYDSAGAPDHRLFRSTDLGHSWSPVPNPDPVARPVRLFRDRANALYLGCTHGLLLAQEGSEYGLDWRIYHRFSAHADDPNARVYSLSGPDSGTGYWATIVSAVPQEWGAVNRLYRQIEAGEWISIDVSAESNYPVLEVAQAHQGGVYLSTVSGRPDVPLLYSPDSGVNWSRVDYGTRVYPSEKGSFLGGGPHFVWYSSRWGIVSVRLSVVNSGMYLEAWRLVDFYVDEIGNEYATMGRIDRNSAVLIYRARSQHERSPILQTTVPGPFLHPINDRRTTILVPYSPQKWLAVQKGDIWWTHNQGAGWKKVAYSPIDSIRHAIIVGDFLYVSGAEGLYSLYLKNFTWWQALITDRGIGKFLLDPSGILLLEADSLGVVRYVPDKGFDSLAWYSPARRPGARLFTIDRFNRPIVRSNGRFHRLSPLGDFWSDIVPPVPADSVHSLLYIDHQTQIFSDRESVWRTIDGGEIWEQTLLAGEEVRSLTVASAERVPSQGGGDILQIVAATDRRLWSSYDAGLSWTEMTGNLPTTDAIVSYAYDPHTGLHLAALDHAGIFWSERQLVSGVAGAELQGATVVTVDAGGGVEFVLEPGVVPVSVRAYDIVGRAVPGETILLGSSVAGGNGFRVRWTPSAPTSGLIFLSIAETHSRMTPHITIKVVLP